MSAGFDWPTRFCSKTMEAMYTSEDDYTQFINQVFLQIEHIELIVHGLKGRLDPLVSRCLLISPCTAPLLTPMVRSRTSSALSLAHGRTIYGSAITSSCSTHVSAFTCSFETYLIISSTLHNILTTQDPSYNRSNRVYTAQRPFRLPERTDPEKHDKISEGMLRAKDV